MTRFAFIAAFAMAAPFAPAMAAPVDLSLWVVDGAGNWTLEAGNNGVKQSLNSRPTVFHDGSASSQGTALGGTIEVQTTSDDDFVGFVLGYAQGDLFGANTPNSFLLLDWKQNDQAGWGEGMALSLVTASIDAGGTATGSNAWQHEGAVTFITRANAAGANYADTGWEDNTEYTFSLEFSATNLKVFVDGNLEFDVDASAAGLAAFPDGAFGFYNYSQPNVRYAGITEDVLPPTPDPNPSAVPVPAAAPLLLAGLGGLVLARRRKRG